MVVSAKDRKAAQAAREKEALARLGGRRIRFIAYGNTLAALERIAAREGFAGKQRLGEALTWLIHKADESAAEWAELYKNEKEVLRKNRKLIQKKKAADRSRTWYFNNPEKAKSIAKAWVIENKDRASELSSNWRKLNPAMCAEFAAKRRAAKLQRTPKWLNELDFQLIREIYEQAQSLTFSTGIAHHVDHVYPLRGKTVSGLHVPSNLQILTACENSKKGNRFFENDDIVSTHETDEGLTDETDS